MNNPSLSNDLLANVDKTVRLEDDIFVYVNGKWLTETVLPDDKSRWGNFDILHEKSSSDVKNLLESNDFNDEEFLKAKFFYNAGMDIKRRNELDFEPIKNILNSINAMITKDDLIKVLIQLAEEGFLHVFGIGSQIDRKDTKREVLHVYSSGLSLPGIGFTNKDYYLDESKKEIREKYINHLKKYFEFINSDYPNDNAVKALEFETDLAKHHFDQVQKRDPELTYNGTDIDSFQTTYPRLIWADFFRAYTTIEITKIVFDNPGFVKYVDSILVDSKISDWKIYLTARVLNSSASLLSERFVQEDFEFYGKIIRGQKVIEENYKRVLNTINNRFILGELVGKYYVKKYFPQSSKDKMDNLVANLLESMGERIQKLDWMSAQTKEKALNKLKHFKVKIGYPDKWEDYTKLRFEEKDSYFDVVTKASNFIQKILIDNLYKAPNPYIWGMSPQTINAYYSPYRNEIVFPAAILQFPFFNEKLSDAENYGGIGTVIGHEITHGFDDKGSQFDFDGNMKNWWSEDDKKQFQEKGNYLIKEYEQFLVGGKPLNGKLTLGENIGDHGGIKLSYQSLLKNYEKKNAREDDENLSSEEKFFYAYSRLWRSIQRPEVEETLRTTDPHSHPKARVNITLANISEFQEYFKIKEGDKLFRKDIPKIW